MFAEFVHACVSFLAKAEEYFIVCIHPFFIHSSIDGHMGCFHILAIVNSCNELGVQIFVQVPAYTSFGYDVPRSVIAASYGNSTFSFLKDHQTIFHSGCTILHSLPTPTVHRVSIFPQTHQHLSFIYLIIANLMGVKWYLTGAKLSDFWMRDIPMMLSSK